MAAAGRGERPAGARVHLPLVPRRKRAISTGPRSRGGVGGLPGGAARGRARRISEVGRGLPCRLVPAGDRLVAPPLPAGGADLPCYEPTAAVEVAAKFCRDLGPREFVGTASRLLTIRNLLRDLTAGAAVDHTERLVALVRQRDEVEEAIRAVTEGRDTSMDHTAVREIYAQVVTTARELLADLRSVEAAMRALDRDVRARVTAWDGPRGELLETVFGSQEAIGASDQGKSWQAFWDHLLSGTAQ